MFDICDLLVLIEPVHSLVKLIYMPGSGLRNAIGLLSLLARCGRRLVGCVCCCLGLADASLRTRIHIRNVASILGIHFIQFAQTVVDGVGLLLDP